MGFSAGVSRAPPRLRPSRAAWSRLPGPALRAEQAVLTARPPCRSSPAMPTDLSGTWNLLTSDNFEGYMLALGRRRGGGGAAGASACLGSGRGLVSLFPGAATPLPLLSACWSPHASVCRFPSLSCVPPSTCPSTHSLVARPPVLLSLLSPSPPSARRSITPVCLPVRVCIRLFPILPSPPTPCHLAGPMIPLTLPRPPLHPPLVPSTDPLPARRPALLSQRRF